MKKFILMTAAAMTLGATSLSGLADAAPVYPMRQVTAQHVMPKQDWSRTRYDQNRFDRFQRGQRLPAEYRRGEISDWRTHRLAQPPRGYHYVRVGNDAVLTAITTGVIAAVIANAMNH